jgi:hypothetical protein
MEAHMTHKKKGVSTAKMCDALGMWGECGLYASCFPRAARGRAHAHAQLAICELVYV